MPVLKEAKKQGNDQSFRKRLEKHRAKTECATCHSRIDPLGFGLEDFDALGRWRTEQAGQPIDSTGSLPTGEEFEGPVELKALLLANGGPSSCGILRGRCWVMVWPANSLAWTCVSSKNAPMPWNTANFKCRGCWKPSLLSYPFSHRRDE